MIILRLDDLYKMTAYIYSDKNIGRSAAATFAHFVEVCGMLTIHDRKKRREGIDVTGALCKALGWYFPLMAKMGVRSVEQIVFRKFPNVCPYCRVAPHNESKCKLVRGTASTVDHDALGAIFRANWEHRPTGLDQWQEMFNTIYPRDLEDKGRSTIGLFEELGELAEAVRVFDQYPKYFLGEAADTFSYIMGIANEHAIRLEQESDNTFSFEQEFLRRYPGLCVQCGAEICMCPSVPEATVGRMAKEIAIGPTEDLFVKDVAEFGQEGKFVGRTVLELRGGHKGLSADLPFDRGDANRALVILCLKIAEAIEGGENNLATTLRREAVRISNESQRAGTARKPFELATLLGDLGRAWSGVSDEFRASIRNTEGLVGELGDILDTTRVLFVSSNATSSSHIRVTAELRTVREAAKRGTSGRNVLITDLPGATSTDFRRALLDSEFDIVHFAGHADENGLEFEDEKGDANYVALQTVAGLIQRNNSVKGVVLNACKSVKNMATPISDFTIGMDDTIDDEASIAFARGFYDAVRRGHTLQSAFDEGVLSVRSEEIVAADADKIRMLTKGG